MWGYTHTTTDCKIHYVFFDGPSTGDVMTIIYPLT